MKCAEFASLVHDFDRPGTEAFSVRAAAMAHAESCDACRHLLEDVRSLDLALDSLATAHAGVAAPERLEAALLAEFRRRNEERRRPRRRLRVAALATAACGLLAFGVVWRVRSVGTAASSVSITASVATSSATPGQPALASQMVVPSAAVSGKARPVAAEDAGAAAMTAVTPREGNAEYATSFVSLPYADDPATLDGATVVRVMVSRSMLASFGMPVAELGATERIPADIALSEDGVPQAIRLVADANADAGVN